MPHTPILWPQFRPSRARRAPLYLLYLLNLLRPLGCPKSPRTAADAAWYCGPARRPAGALRSLFPVLCSLFSVLCSLTAAQAAVPQFTENVACDPLRVRLPRGVEATPTPPLESYRFVGQRPDGSTVEFDAFDPEQLWRRDQRLGAWADKDGKYWVGDDLTITLKDCSNVRGKLLVRFRDPNDNGRTAKGSFDGNRAFTVPRHAKGKGNPDGSYWVTLPVDMEDFLDGKLELRIQKTAGPNLMIDRVIVVPNEA